MKELLGVSPVTSALQGLSMCFPNCSVMVKCGDQIENIVVRKDVDNSKRVSIISGGGSGHAPAHEGFVAAGMLTAAISGAVFTSPSVSQIFKGIRAVTKKASEGGKGCLLVVKNYTGDILNFRLAKEMATQAGYVVEMIIVGDDVTHMRGISGTVFLHKLCGAMAERGDNLSEIMEIINRLELMANSHGDVFSHPFVRSIGIGLNAITLPGHSEPLYDLTDSDNQFELGLGIHGEKGVSRLELPESDVLPNIVDVMVEHLLAITNGKQNRQCVLMLNNLGSATLLEMFNIAKETVTLLEKLNISTQRIYVGTFMTALNMHGFSMSLMYLGEDPSFREEILRLLDANTDSIFWPSSLNLSAFSSSRTYVDTIEVSSTEQKDTTVVEGDLDEIKSLSKVVMQICNHTKKRFEYYNKLDSEVADGDFGDSMNRAADSIIHNVLNNTEIVSLPEFFYRIGLSIQDSGGSSGAIISMFFLKYSRSLKSQEQHTKTRKHINAFIAGVKGMMELGGAKQGDRTLLDALIPIVTYLEQTEDNAIPSQQIESLAFTGAENTKQMLASKGRSRYLGARVLNHVDPGAQAMSEFVKIWADWMQSDN